MAECALKICISTNLDEIAAQVDRACAFFEAAQDDDPLKIEMARFGEIDFDRDVVSVTSVDGYSMTVHYSWRPELQSIFDKLDARL